MKLSSVVLLSAATLTVAEAHAHNHAHLHAARHGSPLEVREPAVVTTTVDGPVTTVYVLNGKDIPYSQAEQGLNDGEYVLLPPSTPSTPSTLTPNSSVAPPEFLQEVTSTSSSISVPPTTTALTPTSPVVAPVSSSGSGNINADFPSGTIPCTEFPAEYGAVPLSYLDLGGWSGVQQVPSFINGVTDAISDIITAIAGSSCTPNSFCSYACPAGYQKSQWPSPQGSTGQSIGGLYCNTDGMLELSRTAVPQICIPGQGGVQVSSSLLANACICRTDYPGTESETIPLDVTPGGIFPLTNPDQATYYSWEGSDTSAQYYINPSGYPCSEACVWGSAGSNLGNWAPVNCGVGWSAGVTYLSLFPNAPTNPDGKLGFDVTINGANEVCSYSGGSYYLNGVESPNGCTVSTNQDMYPAHRLLTVWQVALYGDGPATFEFSE
jgi:hypothetical protein